MSGHRAKLGILVVMALIAGAFGASGTASASSSVSPIPFVASGSVNQVYVTGLLAGTSAELVNRTGTQVATNSADFS